MSGFSPSRWVRHFRLSILRPLRVFLAARQRAKAHGLFIGVTGSSAKSSTVALIAAVMRKKGNVLAQVMDNTINPLIRTIGKALEADYIVVENGVGGRGQMQAMASLLRPDLVVVTLVGIEHYSSFRSAEAIAEEKGYLVEAVSSNGLAVLNADDPLVMAMAKRTRARIVTFGYNPDADYRILSAKPALSGAMTVEIATGNHCLKVQTRFMGAHFALSVAAAIAVGMELGVPWEDVCDAVSTNNPLRLRLSPHKIEGGPLFLADCVKAPEASLHLAFESLAAVSAKRRRIVLGTIADYKGTRRRIYRKAIESALKVADEVILVTQGLDQERLAPQAAIEGRYRCFATTYEAANYISQTARDDEVILLKGSSNFHLERIMIAMKAEVRCWELACGRSESCYKCGLYNFEHHRHGWIRRRRRWGFFGRHLR